MQFEPHERARFLLDEALVKSSSPDEQRWLNTHLAGCAECSRYAELSRRTIRALDGFAFELDPVAAMRVQRVIRGHASHLASNESHNRSLLAGMMIAIFLTITGSMAMWQAAAWLAARWNLPTPAWQIGFAIFWPLPSVLLGMLPFFRSKLMGRDSGGERQTV
jgi:hypothetical protein